MSARKAGQAGQRWERRPDARPQEILDAALTVFAERGYRATSMDEVAEAAGVTKRTLYQYFPAKIDLLVQAVEQRQLQRAARYEAMVRELDGPVTLKLRTLVRRAVADAADPQYSCVIRLVAGDLSVEAPDIARRLMRNGFGRACRAVEGVLRDGQASGEFRSDVDVVVVARLVVSGIAQQSKLALGAGADELAELDSDRFADSVSEFLIHGLRPIIAMEAPRHRARSGGSRSNRSSRAS